LGKKDAALADIERAINLNPKSAEALTYRARLFHGNGDMQRAASDYAKAISSDPKYSEALIGYSQLLSRSKDNKLRDGKKALEYAKRAVALTQEQNYWALDALASSYAESAQFKEAVDAESKALKLAESVVIDSQTIRAHLELFKTRQPLRD
jgi:tetratricopeptide (TPR) repeat protein